ncbi:hypothetical protein ACFIOY_32075 [Bradyrhizobium sp. TZ2]
MQNSGTGSVVVSPRVWNPTETRFDPDYHRTDGKGFRKLSLDCGSREVSEAFQGTAADAKTAADEVADMPETNQVPSAVRDQASFELLRFLFWRHLSVKARSEILVALKLLMAPPAGPLPYAFERQAFDLAAQQGQLGELWDLTMRQVPESERKPNPFNGGNNVV